MFSGLFDRVLASLVDRWPALAGAGLFLALLLALSLLRGRRPWGELATLALFGATFLAVPLAAGVMFPEVPSLRLLLLAFFTAVATTFGAWLVLHRHPVYSALSFALVVVGVVGVLLLLGAPFLAASTVIVYAGAVIVTFLFVIMLSQQRTGAAYDWALRAPVAGIAGAVVLGAVLLLGVTRVPTADRVALADVQTIRRSLADYGALDPAARLPALRGRSIYTALREGIQVRGDTEALTRLDALEGVAASLFHRGDQPNDADAARLRQDLRDLTLAVAPATYPEPVALTPRLADLRPGDRSSTTVLGRALWGEYLVTVELGGLLLLVATLGAVAAAMPATPRGTTGTPGMMGRL